MAIRIKNGGRVEVVRWSRKNVRHLQKKNVENAHKKHYERQVEIIIKIGDEILFQGHKDDSVINGIVRANPNCTVEWVDKSRVDDPREFMRGIK